MHGWLQQVLTFGKLAGQRHVSEKKNSKRLIVKWTVKGFFPIKKTQLCATYWCLGRSNRNASLKCQSCLYSILCGICCLHIVYTLITHIACKWPTWTGCYWSDHTDISHWRCLSYVSSCSVRLILEFWHPTHLTKHNPSLKTDSEKEDKAISAVITAAKPSSGLIGWLKPLQQIWETKYWFTRQSGRNYLISCFLLQQTCVHWTQVKTSELLSRGLNLVVYQFTICM